MSRELLTLITILLAAVIAITLRLVQVDRIRRAREHGPP